MIRKIAGFLILVPLALVLIALSIANKQPVAVSFDPFSAGAPAFALKAPLYLVAFVLLIVGVVIGGIAAWIVQGKWRRAARHEQTELREARNEIDGLRRDLAAREPASPARLPLRPPAA
jgi:uncharacterized membrane protein YciS (DUF1049 family)